MRYFFILAVAAELLEMLPRYGTPPQGRRAASLATDSENNKIYILGGLESQDQWFSDIWQFDLSAKEWKELRAINVGPGIIYIGAFHSAIAFLSSSVLYLYGGITPDGPSSSLWKFDLKSFRWSLVSFDGIKPGMLIKSCTSSFKYDNITYLSVYGQNQTDTSLGYLYL